MASVRKREWEHNGVKRSAWIVEYTDPATGKRKRSTPKSGLKKDADKERLRIEKEIEAGIHVTASATLTVQKAGEEYIRLQERRAKDGKIGDPYYIKVKSNIDKHITPKFGRLKLNELQSNAIEEWYFDLRDQGYAPATIKDILYTFRWLEDFAIKRGYARQTIVAVAMKEIGSMASTKIKTFEAPTIRKLLAAPRLSHQWRMDCALRAYVHIAACCGLRFGEITALSPDDVDLENRIIHVRRSITQAGQIKGPKTKAGFRDVPMPANVAAIIEEWIAKHHRLGNNCNLLFHTITGEPYQNANVRRSYRAALTDLGLDPDIHFHALRHFAASWMVHNHVPLTDVAQMLGHSKFDMTLQVYAHPVSDTKQKAEAIDRMAKGLLEVAHLSV